MLQNYRSLHRSRVADPHALELWLAVNGKNRQRGNTAQMMWRLDELLKHIVRYITLEPGDLVLTGTPAGVGPRMLQKYYAEFFLALLKLNTKALSTKRYTYL